MALLADTRTSPVGGWKYVQPETGLWFYSGSGPEITEKVAEHRRYKGIEPSDHVSVFRDIQRQICSGLAQPACRPEPGENYQPTADIARDLTTDKAIAFSKTVFESIKVLTLEPKAESERRAAICRSCQFNRPTGTCACSPYWAIVDALVPKKRTEPGLHVCAACGCTLRAKVLLPKEAIRAGNEGRDINFPPHCWQIQ